MFRVRLFRRCVSISLILLLIISSIISASLLLRRLSILSTTDGPLYGIATAYQRSLLLESEAFWKKNPPPKSNPLIERLAEELTPNQHALAAAIDTIGPPIIVTGTAGTGTRVAHDLLVAAGVETSHIVNPERDSRLLIALVKNTDAFCQPYSQSYSNQSTADTNNRANCLIQWIAERGIMDYELDQIAGYPFYAALNASMDRLVAVLHSEALLRLVHGKSDRVGTGRFTWGFKESQVMFVLPFLLQRFRPSADRRMSIVHVVRDGRDIAFSKQQRAKYQRYYVNLISRYLSDAWETNSAQKSRYAIQVARTWQFINEGIAKWAKRHSEDINYVQFRLEDICRPESRVSAALKLVRSLDLAPSDQERFLASVNQLVSDGRCNLGKYYKQDPQLVRQIDQAIRRGLQLFGYEPIAAQAAQQPFQLRDDKGEALRRYKELLGQDKEQPVVVVYVTRSHFQLFFNWLKFLLDATSGRSSANRLSVIVHSNYRGLYEMLVSNENKITLQPAYQIIINAAKSPRSTVKLFPILCQSDGCEKHGRNQVWPLRLQLVLTLIEAGISVVQTDLDALWVRDILRADLQLKDSLLGANRSIWERFDIIASQGRFPKEFKHIWEKGTGKRNFHPRWIRWNNHWSQCAWDGYFSNLIEKLSSFYNLR